MKTSSRTSTPPQEDSAVIEIFGGLPDRDRELLALVAWEGLSNAEIGPGGRALLAAITAEEVPVSRRRRHRRLPVLVAGVMAAAAAVAAVVGVGGQNPAPLRSYANAAVAIDVKGTGYEVEVKNAYADQREFTDAFAKFGLDVRLRIVPVTPGDEREIVQIGSLHAPRVCA